jgi:DNA-binding transcriptional regulator YhcF (GntR family)
MKLWLSKSSEVPIQEQLSTQLILGIVSADLAPGERLPSTSELARRFNIHANTVRAAYRDLTQRGWIDWRQGSGFYVRAHGATQTLDRNLDLDHLISTFLSIARQRGHSLKEIQSHIARWFSLQAPDHLLVIEPDRELREILVTELKEKISLRVEGADLTICSNAKKLLGAMCVALYDHADDVKRALPVEASCVLLRSRSVPKSLAGRARPPRDMLITVISRWPDFLHWARATLVAVGIEPVALDLRDAQKKGWDRGLTARSFIITDSLLGSKLPPGCKAQVFQLISDESIEEVRAKLSNPV